MGKEDGAALPGAKGLRPGREASEHGGVEHQRLVEAARQQRVEHRLERRAVLESAADQDRLGSGRPSSRGAIASAAMQPSSVSGQPTTRASGIATASAGATLAPVAIWSLPAPARSAAGSGEQGGAGQLAASGDDEEPAAILLVAVVGMVGKREAAEQVPVEHLELAHRAATIASGSEVIGASSSISGAAKL